MSSCLSLCLSIYLSIYLSICLFIYLSIDLSIYLPTYLNVLCVCVCACARASCNLRRKEMFYFNDALRTFYLRLYGVRHMVKDHSETRCRHMGYSFRLTARVLLYAPSQRQDNTYHGLCYTSRGALAGTRNSPMGPLHEESIRRPIAL